MRDSGVIETIDVDCGALSDRDRASILGDIVDYKLDDCMAEYESRYLNTDLYRCTQNQFAGSLKFCNQQLFYKPQQLILLYKNRGIVCLPKMGGKVGVRGLDYDLDVLELLFGWYASRCDIYDKVCMISGFMDLIGGSAGLVRNWRDGGEIKSRFIAAQILDTEEQSALASAVSGKRNPVGLAILLNHRYGYNKIGVTDNRPDVADMSAAELPDLRQSQYLVSKKNIDIKED